MAPVPRPPSRLPPLGALRAFEAAARHLSFTKAAAELGTTQAAVSWQIKSLEQYVGVALFERLPRRLTLTEAGAAMAPGIAAGFLHLGNAVAAATAPPTAAAVLSISAAPTVANNWLVPRLGRFQLNHPDIAVRFDAKTELVDFLGDPEAPDVAIRSGSGSWPGLAAHRLLPVSFTPLCTPALLARLGPKPRPRDLMKLPLLQPFEMWKNWLAVAGETHLPATRPTIAATFPHQHMVGRAAIAGHGVALLNAAFFPIPLGDGRLLQPFPQVWQSDAESYWLVYPKLRAASRKIAAFRRWLLEEAGVGEHEAADKRRSKDAGRKRKKT